MHQGTWPGNLAWGRDGDALKQGVCLRSRWFPSWHGHCRGWQHRRCGAGLGWAWWSMRVSLGARWC